MHVDGAVILESLAGRDLAGHLEDRVLRLALGKSGSEGLVHHDCLSHLGPVAEPEPLLQPQQP